MLSAHFEIAETCATCAKVLGSVGVASRADVTTEPDSKQPLPERWAIGAIGGMAVDSHDNVWVLHRPGPLQKNERFAGAAMTPPKAHSSKTLPPPKP